MESDFMKARISQLHKTEAEWLRLSNWTPEAGEIIVYDPDNRVNYPRIKIGDGKKSLEELSFLINSAVADYLQEQRYQEIIDGGRITNFKK